MRDRIRKAAGSRTFYYGVLIAVLCGLTAYLLSCHYLKAYSDPYGWLHRAQRMLEGNPDTRRAPVYPAFLVFARGILGPAYVFLSNLPFVVLIVFLVSTLTRYCYPRPKDGGKESEKAYLSGILAAAVLILSSHTLLLELLNPFREALAFCLLLGSLVIVLRYLDKGGLWTLFPAGAMIGLAIGVRETCILVLPPLGMLFIFKMLTDRKMPHARVALLFGAGLALGLVPFILQNIHHTGRFWLPSYAARRWQLQDAVARTEHFPVPGMDYRYLATTGKKTLLMFLEKYHWLGVALFALGVLRSLKLKSARLLLLILPAVLFNLGFYSFYWYVKERYLFVVDLFSVPFIAYGVVAVAGWAGMWAGRYADWFALWKERLLAVVAAILVTGVLVFNVAHRPPLMRAWQVEEFQDSIRPSLTAPYAFTSTRRHYTQMLSWLLEASHKVSEPALSRRDVVKAGLDGTLRTVGHRIMEEYGNVNVYSYGDRHPYLLRNWFDFEKVLSFQDLPTVPDHYGKPLNKSLYRVRQWSRRELSRKVTVPPGSDRYLLVADFYRLWDFGERTYCAVNLGGESSPEKVPNGTHFHEFSASLVMDGEIEVQVVSDAPLPAEPLLEVFPMGKSFTMELGAGPKYWYYPFLSESLNDAAPMKGDAALLFDDGMIKVPRFAGAESEVIAVFTLEFYQEDFVSGEGSFLVLETEAERRRSLLPPRRVTDRVGISLGPGSGSLDLVPVSLHTTLPSFLDQHKVRTKGIVPGYGYVKLKAVQLDLIPVVLRQLVAIDIGASDDAWILEGFYRKEKHEGKFPVRWTSGRALVRLPEPEEGTEVEVILRTREVRPPPLRALPRFLVYGVEVAPEKVEVRETEGGVVEYRFRSGSSRARGDTPRELEIVSPEWIPADFSLGSDTRRLGILIETIEVRPLPVSKLEE